MLISQAVGAANVSAITKSAPNRGWSRAWGTCDFIRDAPKGLPVCLQTQQAAAGAPGTDGDLDSFIHDLYFKVDYQLMTSVF